MSDSIRSISQNNYLLSNGGGGHEYSGANGVYVDNENEVIGLDTSASNAIETVIENSGAWGGAGLPISAGPGIKVGLENGVLMIRNDETVIYSGDFGTQGGKYLILNESMNNFDRIKVWANDNNGWGQTIFEFDPNWVGIDNEWRRTIPIIFNTIDVGTNNVYIRGISLHAASPTNVTGVSAYGFDKSLTGNYQTYNCKITKVVGISRKST